MPPWIRRPLILIAALLLAGGLLDLDPVAFGIGTALSVFLILAESAV